jgi:hypothetical protein
MLLTTPAQARISHHHQRLERLVRIDAGHQAAFCFDVLMAASPRPCALRQPAPMLTSLTAAVLPVFRGALSSNCDTRSR